MIDGWRIINFRENNLVGKNFKNNEENIFKAVGNINGRVQTYCWWNREIILVEYRK